MHFNTLQDSKAIKINNDLLKKYQNLPLKCHFQSKIQFSMFSLILKSNILSF